MDCIVAGAGLWGCVIAHRLAALGKKVLLIDRRSVIGGNVRCEFDQETGIEIHKYGSHIFHTNIPEVWKFINKFTRFNSYQHKVLSQVKDKKYFLPIGLNLINNFFNVNLVPYEVEKFLNEKDNYDILIDNFFRGYTFKQWGRDITNINKNVIKRIPIRNNYNINYFYDFNQGIPLDGYNSIFENLTDDKNITIECNAKLCFNSKNFAIDDYVIPSNITIYYSGPLDELFNYEFGCLPWRTLKFKTRKIDVQDFQGTAVVNYPEIEIPYTRIHEFKHYHPENEKMMNLNKTIITEEYSREWNPGDEPFYPINDIVSEEILTKYKNKAKNFPNLVVGGRLGEYKYYDMDKTINSALNITLCV